MPEKRFQGSQSQTHPKGSRNQNVLRFHRFIGLSLGGGKNDRTSLAVLDYYPQQNKLFLTHIYEKIQSEGSCSADQIVYQIIKEHSQKLEYLCIDAPLQLPKCVRCKLQCPGFEKCKEKEIQWMWKQFDKHQKKKNRAKLFTPYTQRAVEIFLTTEVDEPIQPLEALGANNAPLAARAHFLLRRLSKKIKTIEVYPHLSVLRIGQALKITKSHSRFYKHSVGGDESRQILVQSLMKKDLVFIYHQDLAKLVENVDSFDAFISAFTGFLKFKGQCEKTPKDFPKTEAWIDFPVKQLSL